jgi:hypothetical protein
MNAINFFLVNSLLCIGAAIEADDQASSCGGSADTAPVYGQLSPVPSFSVVSSSKSASSTATTTTLHPGGGSGIDSGVEVSYQTNAAAAAGYSGFFEGILGCLRPVWSVIGKATSTESKQKGGRFVSFCCARSEYVTFQKYDAGK